MCTTMRSVTRGWALIVAGCLGIALQGALFAADPAASQVWLISTRGAPLFCHQGADLAAFSYWRQSTDGQWAAADAKAFLATDSPQLPTMIYIHGNRADYCDAVSEGLGFYRLVQSLAPGRAMRFVIWSWPADRISGGVRQDVQVKACRSDGQSCHLAHLLQRMDPAVPVCMAGYSFGARIITGALHMLAGGEVAGQVLAERSGSPRPGPLRAVLVAAAEDYDWLLPDRAHGLALGRLDRALVTVNGNDPVLKRYPMMYSLRGPQALGYAGPACPSWLGPNREKLELVNVTCSVGNSHSWDCYVASPFVLGRLAWYAFLEPSP